MRKLVNVAVGSFASILVCPRHVRLRCNLGKGGCSVLSVRRLPGRDSGARPRGAWANTHRSPIAKTLSVLARYHSAAFLRLAQKAIDMSAQKRFRTYQDREHGPGISASRSMTPWQ